MKKCNVCDKELKGLDSYTCKYCKKIFCAEHIYTYDSMVKKPLLFCKECHEKRKSK